LWRREGRKGIKRKKRENSLLEQLERLAHHARGRGVRDGGIAAEKHGRLFKTVAKKKPGRKRNEEEKRSVKVRGKRKGPSQLPITVSTVSRNRGSQH